MPELAGAYGGAIISATSYPSRYSPWLQDVRAGNIQVVSNVAINLFKEFSLELDRLKSLPSTYPSEVV